MKLSLELQFKKILPYIIYSIIVIVCVVLGIIIGIYIDKKYEFDIKNLLEILYFSSGPLLVIVSFIGLYQIVLAKNNFHLSAKRESYKMAIQQCDIFRDKIINDFSDFNNANLNIFINEIDIQFDERHEPQLIQKIQNLSTSKEDISELYKKSICFLNELEAFSMYFVQGLAQDEIGYLPLAITYCNFVEKLSPILAPNYKAGYYNNIKILFEKWGCRLAQKKREQEQSKCLIEDSSALPITAIGCKTNSK